MGFSSQSGSVVLRTQTVAGTYNADTLTAGVGLITTSGALDSNRDLLKTDAEIGGGRDVTTAYLGSIMWNGTYEFYVRMEALRTLMKAAFGAATPVTTTGVTTTTITPLDSTALPILSIHEEVGGAAGGFDAFNYNDAVVNSLNISCDANALMKGSAGIIAKNQVAGATIGAATTVDQSAVVVAPNITLTYNAVSLSVKTFAFDFTNNFEDSDYRVGSFFLGDLTPKRREVNFSFTVRETSSALWRQATYGLASATAPGGLPTANQLILTASTYETIPSGTPTTAYSLTMTIPKFILSPYSVDASGDDVIESGIDGSAVRPTVGTPIVTAVVKGGMATVA